MPTVHFTGRVFPPMGLSLGSHLLRVQWRDPATSLEIAATVNIQNSEVDVECELSREFEQADFELMHLHSFKLARTFVDWAAFQTGIGQTFILETFIASDGARKTIQAHDSRLAANCSVSLDDVIYMMIYEPQLSKVLNLLTSTLDRPHVIPVNCAIAVESIAQLISPGEKNKKKLWGNLQDKLNLTEPYVKCISALSSGPRHGDNWMEPPSAEQIESRRRAWIIMNRYLEFRKGGGVARLFAPQFPEL